MKDYVEIVAILDRSGSMEMIKDSTIKGFNQFLREQKSIPGNATFTAVLFDDMYELLCSGVPLQEAKYLTTETFVPRGMTALLDAIGKTIDETGARLNRLAEEDKPKKVLVVIVTDGMENASRDYSNLKVAEMIQHQREKYNWEFVFLGANIDSFSVAGNLNISPKFTSNYEATSKGVQTAYRTASGYIKGLRS